MIPTNISIRNIHRALGELGRKVGAAIKTLEMQTPSAQHQNRMAGGLTVARAILDLGVNMTDLKKEGDIWKGHKQLVFRHFSEQRQEYLERIRTIIEKAKSAKADILVLPACTFPYHSKADLRLFRQEARGIPWVVGGLLKIEKGRREPRFSETWESWHRGRKRVAYDNETVGWLKMGTVSAMVAISSTIGMISYGWYKRSRVEPPLESHDLLALDLGHHQYSGRYLKTLRRVSQTIKSITPGRGLVLLSYWKYKNSKSKNRWSNPEFQSGMRFARTRIEHGMGEGEDWLDIFVLERKCK